MLAPDGELKETTSSSKAIYTPLPPPPRTSGIRAHNKKTELLFQVHAEVVGEERAHLDKPAEPTDYTTTKQHFQNMFPETAPVEHVTTKEHNFLTDQPATFWHEQLATKSIPGTTVVTDANSPYKKNAKFTTPQDDLRTGIASG